MTWASSLSLVVVKGNDGGNLLMREGSLFLLVFTTGMGSVEVRYIVNEASGVSTDRH